MQEYHALLRLKDQDKDSHPFKNFDFSAEDDAAAKEIAIDWARKELPQHYELDELILSNNGVEVWRWSNDAIVP